MAGIQCQLSDDAREKIAKVVEGGDSAMNMALILRCVKGTALIEAEDILDDYSPDDLGEELPESSPRFVLYRYALSKGYFETTTTNQIVLALIFFNPTDCDMPIKRMYIASRDNILKELNNPSVKEFELNDVSDFGDAWFNHKVIGKTGTLADATEESTTQHSWNK